MRTQTLSLVLALGAWCLTPSCASMYYGAMEAIGVPKREIFVDRVKEGRQAQEDAKKQFSSALEAFKATTKFDGGKLESVYEKLNDEYESCESRVENVQSRIKGIESVSEALFDEWKDEIGQMQNADLKRRSEASLRDTQRRYEGLIDAMKKAESKMAPVLVSLRDHVLFLKHNLNAQAIASLQGDLSEIEGDVGALIGDMQKAISEADAFIQQLEGKPQAERGAVRIVSLCPSLTELVFELGRGDELVGITDYCVHPAERVGAVEKVGGTKTPKVARIVELAPDVVLLNEEENRIEDAQALEARGVRCLNTFPKDALETAAMVRKIGAALERREAAERVALDIEARAKRVATAARSRRAVSWAYLIWRRPWMSVNRDTFASALLTLAGGRNVFGDSPTRYPEIRIDELVAANPDLVLLCTEPFPFEDKHIDELCAATGWPRSRFRIADGEYLSWHGSRTPAGIDYADSLIASL